MHKCAILGQRDTRAFANPESLRKAYLSRMPGMSSQGFPCARQDRSSILLSLTIPQNNFPAFDLQSRNWCRGRILPHSGVVCRMTQSVLSSCALFLYL